ncbi:hypothetical protein INE94_00971 [Parabacteroides distasonis]|nr:hypothetical protein INE94_00971 [Parabacteroides distasonis]
MNKRHYEHTLPNIRGSLSNTYFYSFNSFIKIHQLCFIRNIYCIIMLWQLVLCHSIYYSKLYSKFRQTAIYFLHILENILIQYPCIVFCYACICMT